MDITPLHNWVLLKKYNPMLPQKDKKSFIILPGEDNKPRNWANIVDCGSECKLMWIENDLVQFIPYNSQSVEGHDDLFLVKEENITAIIQLPAAIKEEHMSATN